MRMLLFWSGALLLISGLVEAGVREEADRGERRDRYRIDLELDYGGARYIGRQSFEWTNRQDSAVDVLEFSLYPNVGLSQGKESGTVGLVVEEVRAEGRQVRWTYRSKRTMVRVEFVRRVESGERIEIQFRFRGRVPRVPREETSLLAHFMEEVNDAFEDERAPADARDIFFAGEEAMLVCYFHPILSVRPSGLSEVSFPIGVSRLALAGIADYDVSLRLAAGVVPGGMAFGTGGVGGAGGVGGTGGVDDLQVLTSGRMVRSPSREGRTRAYRFIGEARRAFALAIGEKLRMEERQVGRTLVQSWYRDGDQDEARRVLEIVAGALSIYRDSFGEYPYETLRVVEFPVAAGYSSIDLPGVIVLPRAYYVDFGSSRMSGVIREQADVIRASFELNVARAVASQWWGRVVGTDGERAPFVAESLAGFAAILYHEKRYGAALGDSIVRQYVRGAYQAYRILGGTDDEGEQPAKEFDRSLQYAAIVQTKGALMMLAFREMLGQEQFLSVLRDIYRCWSGEILSGEQLRNSLLSASGDTRAARMIFQRWLREKRGDEDIGSPELSQVPAPVSKIRALGRIFLRIGRKAARPF